MSDDSSLERTVRQAQTVVPFGVGAIYDFRGESFVACDTTQWRYGKELVSERLAQELGVAGFKMAPEVPRFGTPRRTPYARFPQWLFCGTCRRMTYVRRRDEKLDEPQTCSVCRGNPQLIPMRFVLVCSEGHLGDFPWTYWAHSRATAPNQRGCKSWDLSLDVHKERGVGLGALTVRCRTCSAERSLQGITSDESIRSLGIRCSGRQPWQRPDDAEECTASPKVLQRGASNLYFASVASALDIPPESRRSTIPDLGAAIRAHERFDIIASNPDGPIANILVHAVADEVGCSDEDVRQVVEQEIVNRAGGAPAPDSSGIAEDRQSAEWVALLNPEPETDHRQTFASRRVDLTDGGAGRPAVQELDALVAEVRSVTRLREVRALTGFQRYDLDQGSELAPDLGAGLDWLPAVEVFGEGIFISLNEAPVQAWETGAEVNRRLQSVRRRHEQSFLKGRVDHVTPRFVLVHTFAHLLLRRLAFEAGYPAASLRERIYARPPNESGGPQAGVLIYTAAGDYDGTLGGLVRMGEPPRLAHTVLAALEEAMWCSSDPVCIESSGQGYGGLNLAACHACALLAETSCTHWNLLLDRGLILGKGDVPGLFQDVVEAAMTGEE